MKLFHHHPYLISFALMLAALPLPAFAIGEDLIHSLVVSVFGLFVWLAALILEFALNHFVLGFGETFTNTGIGVAIDSTWIIIRDFVNMFFIFGFVYIGFKMILNSNDSNTRRWLVNLLLAALLVNFSLFATKFVVDVSNQLAAQIAFGGLSSMQSTTPDGRLQLNLSEELMKRMGVQGALDGTNALPEDAGYQYIFGTAILFLVTTFVFAAGGILLIIRFAVLNFFLMLSPVMFLSWVLPIVKRDTMGEYWSKFIGKAFFAPIYLLFIYFSFRVMDGLQVAVSTPGQNGNPANLANPDWAGTFQKIDPAGGGSVTSSALGTVPFFILICTFMILSLVMAQKLGATGGDRAVAMGKTLSNKFQRGVTRAATKPVRYGGGLAARGVSNAAGGALESQLRRAQQLQGTSYGARATRAIARMNGVQGVVGGAAESMQKAKFGMTRTVEEEQKMRYKTEKNANNAMDVTRGLRAQEVLDAIKNNDGKVKVNNNGIEMEMDWNTMTPEARRAYGLDLIDSDAKDSDGNPISEEIQLQKHSEKMQRLAADMNIKEFEAMSDAQQEKIAEYLGASVTESVGKSENISDEQKTKIGKAQKKAIEKVIVQNGQILSEKVADLSIRQIETLGDEFVTKNAALFSDSQFSDIKKSKKFTESQVGRYIGKRKSDLERMVNENPASVFNLGTGTTGNTNLTTRETTYSTNYTKTKKVSEIAKLPGSVLASTGAAKYLSVDALKAIANGDKDFEKVSTSQRDLIKKNLDRVQRDPSATSEEKTSAEKAIAYLNTAKGQESFFGQEKSDS